MIKYLFEKKFFITRIHIQGHALYIQNTKGDIVCASVSTAIIMTLNAIEIFKLQSKITYKLEEGLFVLKVLIFDFIIEKLLINLEYTLNDLSFNYPLHIQIIKVK
ncbi:MAG: ribosomal-processing cysteine protease Prp [Vigna little leaf phytoplasma]|nr:ribosomal-processing cysteine protease Prp [Vigna little leaf phytoplasma]